MKRYGDDDSAMACGTSICIPVLGVSRDNENVQDVDVYCFLFGLFIDKIVF